jgi:hypothetical protein
MSETSCLAVESGCWEKAGNKEKESIKRRELPGEKRWISLFIPAINLICIIENLE